MTPETLEKRREYSRNYYRNLSEEEKRENNKRRKELQEKRKALGIESFEKHGNYQQLSPKNTLIKDYIALKGVNYG